jgi:hypothetical protein
VPKLPDYSSLRERLIANAVAGAPKLSPQLKRAVAMEAARRRNGVPPTKAPPGRKPLSAEEFVRLVRGQ